MTQDAFAQFTYAAIAPGLLIASIVVEMKQASEKDRLFGQALFEMALWYLAVLAICQIPFARTKVNAAVIVAAGLALLAAATRVVRTLLRTHRLTQRESQIRERFAYCKTESIAD